MAVGRNQEEQAQQNFSECRECTQVEKKAQNIQILPRLERYNHGKRCSLTTMCTENRCVHTPQKMLRGQDFIFCKIQIFQKHALCQGTITSPTVWGIPDEQLFMQS